MSLPAVGAFLAEAEADKLLVLLLVAVLGVVVCLGIGAAVLVLRVILPRAAAATDASLARLTGWRLLLSGILPIVGAGLLSRGIELLGGETLAGIFVLIVVLPLGLAWIGGLMAGLPHMGAKVLRADSQASPLVRASMGGLVVGLAMVSWVVPPLGMIVALLVSGWLVGIGVGALIQRPRTTEDQM